VPKVQPPVGDTKRVYAIPHGCVRLAVPRDDTALPSIVVRQHDRRGRLVVRRARLPDTNLNKANGGIGVCGRESVFYFVAYPFVTVVAQELYDLGEGRRECAAGLDEMLLWTGYISPPHLPIAWYTHRRSS
jgi:hypothetical protein